MKCSLPKLIEVDAALHPNELLFNVPGVPSRVWRKSEFYKDKALSRMMEVHM